MNFVREFLALQDYAAENELTGNEVILLLSIFRVLNDKFWPAGMVAMGNNLLLSKTTFSGSKRDETLREARRRLAERGIIRFTPGEPHGALPTYCIVWEALHPEQADAPAASPEDAPEITPEVTPKKRGETGGEARGFRGGRGLNNNISVESVKNKNKRERGFTPPTVEQVRQYCAAEGLRVVPERFWAYYAGIGWMVGRNPMQDWRAALQAWDCQERERPGGRRLWAQDYTQRQYTEAELEARAAGLDDGRL